jgi:hypothetical protein
VLVYGVAASLSIKGSNIRASALSSTTPTFGCRGSSACRLCRGTLDFTCSAHMVTITAICQFVLDHDPHALSVVHILAVHMLSPSHLVSGQMHRSDEQSIGTDTAPRGGQTPHNSLSYFYPSRCNKPTIWACGVRAEVQSAKANFVACPSYSQWRGGNQGTVL